jgi:hypothetical protein
MDIDAAWASHDEMRAKIEDLRDAITEYLDAGVPDLPAERRLLGLVREAERHLAVPFPDDSEGTRAENAHLRAALHRMRDLGHGMPARWFMREIEDGLTFPAITQPNSH